MYSELAYHQPQVCSVFFLENHRLYYFTVLYIFYFIYLLLSICSLLVLVLTNYKQVRSTKEARRKVDTEMMQNSSGTPSQLKKHHQQHDSSTPTENLNKSEKLKNSSVHNHREGSDIDTIIQPISPEQTPSTGEQETHSHMLHEIKGEDDVVCKKNLHFQEESFALHNHVQDQQDEQQKSEANRCKENEVMRNEDDTTSSRTETCDSYATSNTLKNHNYESLPRKASGSKFQHFTSIGVDKVMNILLA